jgi:hypothetical protein
MKTNAAVLGIALALLGICSGLALAASPKRGGTYLGRSASHHGIRITVARDGRSGTLKYCRRFKVGFRIRRGSFGARLTEAGGLVTIFRIHGHWQTRRLVTGEIGLALGCGGRPGPWSASLR